MSGVIEESSYRNFKKYSPPGAPFPSGRDWINAKRVVDALPSPNYWRVHDNLYDLKGFIDKHPGGREWISETQGTDITELFETSHILHVERVERTLARYLVAEPHPNLQPRNSPYTFRPDGFYKTLKRRVSPILEKRGTGSSSSILLLQDGLVAFYFLAAVTGSWTCSPVTLIMAGLLFGMSVAGSHNFLHLRNSWRRFYMDLSPFTSHEFRLTHALSHHVFPNSIMDLDVEALSPLLETLPGRARSWVKGWPTIFYSHLIYSQVLLLGLGAWIWVAVGRKQWRKEQGLVLLPWLITLLTAPDIWNGIKYQLLIYSVGSYWFAVMSQNHHHPSNFHDGDEPIVSQDFGLRQLDTMLDKREAVHGWLLPILTTFGDHPLHHLFPTVCHSKLGYLRGEFERTLEEFGGKPRVAGQLQLILGTHHQYLREESWDEGQRREALLKEG